MVKAAMLVKFYQHTKWPALPKDTDEKTINICVVGENPFSSKARSVFASACTPERQFNFLKGQAYKKQFCHIVFFGNISQDKMEKILNDLKDVPTLTVSDIPGFANMGGIVELSMVVKSEKDQKIKLIVNEQAALEKGLLLEQEMKHHGVATVIRKSN